ncbi:crossover junction endodeoxyribonuclease RuvC [Nocardia farcinica]|uniref:crossover junction endodeoxyribonuclease RuvC n=1 Tax=Nocardia farcinica TaxID=37329 RepID=UPI00245778F9|nr:crossover junction endodeoxyribonuclease RuvC [Nocardia farcinica]
MRVMGVDPGLTRCGLSMVEGGLGRSVTAIAVDVVRTPADMDLAHRLMLVADAAERWMDEHRPKAVAIERVFAQHNVRTAMGTAQAGGVIALAAARRGIPVVFHTPSEVKASVTGNGKAGKAQLTAMVTRILGLETAPEPADAADALALAICHCWRATLMARMAAAEAQAAEAQRRYAERLAAQRAARERAGQPRPGRAQAPGRRKAAGDETAAVEAARVDGQQDVRRKAVRG